MTLICLGAILSSLTIPFWIDKWGNKVKVKFEHSLTITITLFTLQYNETSELDAVYLREYRSLKISITNICRKIV